MKSTRQIVGLALLGALLLLFTGCMPSKKLTVGATASLLDDVARSCYRQSDLRVIQDGMPAYLLLLDGMLESYPDDPRLLLGAAKCYASYATAFVENTDPEYALALYRRARHHALRALEVKGLPNPRKTPLETFETQVKALSTDDVPFMFWAATCWGGWIRLQSDSIQAVAELPRVIILMQRVLDLDEGYYHGGAHLFMGVWFACRPAMAGGDLAQAQRHFQTAQALGQNRFLMTNVYYAEHYARRMFDRELYQKLLQEVLATPADVVPELTLNNTVAHTKARQMLAEMDVLFD